MDTRYPLLRRISSQLFAMMCGLLLLTPAQTVSANQITLITVIKNQSALLPASWTIYKQNDQKTPVATLPRHSGTVTLPPGQYEATVKLDKVLKAKRFRVEPGIDSTVIVSMDN